jgi:hypothetical protein
MLSKMKDLGESLQNNVFNMILIKCMERERKKIEAKKSTKGEEKELRK